MSRLRDAILWSDKKFQTFQEACAENIRTFVGHRYGTEDEVRRSDVDRTPVNLVEQAHTTYLRFLVNQEPQVTVGTEYPEYVPYASDLEARLNHRFKQINLSRAIQRVVTDTLFGMGVAVIGADADSDEVVPARFIEAVHMSNLVLDLAADSWEGMQYIGDRRRIAMEEAERRYGDVVRRIGATSQNESERREWDVATLHKGESHDVAEFVETFEVLHLWLPRQQVILTIPGDVSIKEVLDEIEWQGPPGGPYEALSFIDVPKSPIPLPMDNLLTETAGAANEMYNKIIGQGKRAKQNELFRAGSSEDAERIKNAQDGEYLGWTGPSDGLLHARVSGPDPSIVALAEMLRTIFKEMAGNLDALAGLSVASDTVGQEQIIQANVSKRIADMQARVDSFARRVIRQFAWYECQDMSPVPGVSKFAEGTDWKVPIGRPREEHARFLLYNFDFVPYSMQYRSPSQELQAIGQVMTMMGPREPLMAQQGIVLNHQVVLDAFAKLTHVPRIRQLYRNMGPPQSYQSPAAPEPGGMPAQTTRTYQRINRPGATSRGKSEMMIAHLLGMAKQPAEQAQMARMVE